MAYSTYVSAPTMKRGKQAAHVNRMNFFAKKRIKFRKILMQSLIYYTRITYK